MQETWAAHQPTDTIGDRRDTSMKTKVANTTIRQKWHVAYTRRSVCECWHDWMMTDSQNCMYFPRSLNTRLTTTRYRSPTHEQCTTIKKNRESPVGDTHTPDQPERCHNVRNTRLFRLTCFLHALWQCLSVSCIFDVFSYAIYSEI